MRVEHNKGQEVLNLMQNLIQMMQSGGQVGARQWAANAKNAVNNKQI